MRFHTIKDSLIAFVKELITNRYHCNNDFETWTYSAIKEAYVGKFKTELEIKSDVEDRLYFAGENLEFAMKSFIHVNPTIALETIIEFAELFMKRQFEQFDSWCHDVHAILSQPA
jgi:hypothetical protein